MVHIGNSWDALLADQFRQEYYLRLRELETFWRRREEGGRKSFRMDELDRSFFLEGEQGVLVPYLEGLQKDLLTRD